MTCWTRSLARIALLAAIVSMALATGGLAREAVAGATAATAECASVTLSDPDCGQSQPVPSLQPEATKRLWRRLVDRREARPLRLAAATSCRPLRAVFYTATDWMRLATRLAANASPCAQYFFSLPSLAADHTQMRADQAWRIRALGPQFHAMAEVSMGAWGKWVTSTRSTWFQAGVEARRRMAKAGYDVRLGDSWAVNEFSSAVRQDVPGARTDARNFVRGLYTGDGTAPATRGAVFTIGMGQGTQNLSVYKTNLDGWLSDSAFWSDMSSYVGDWSQELFGDLRNYGVAGASLATRRTYLNDYLQHVITQAGAGPSATANARSFLQTAYSPLANAAWQFDSGFGWTLVSGAQMQDYVSAQTYALRAYSATSQPGGSDHWGFAWSPKNATGMSAADFDAQSQQIIDRLASAIHDSDQSPDPGDPGRNACGTAWCTAAISGAAFNDGWKSFTYWGPLGLVFTTPAQAIGAGASSQAMTLQLQASGAAQTSPGDVVITLGSSSATGSLSSGNGVWASTLQVTVPAGATTSPAFFYRDTRAGSPLLTAAATGLVSGSQSEVVNPGALASIAVAPNAATVTVGATQTFSATGADAYGNAVPIAGAAWSVSPASLGALAPGSGASAAFTAAAPGSGSVTATVGTVTGSAAVTVAAGPAIPGSPTQLVAATAATRGVTLTWRAPAYQGNSPITSYRIYRGSQVGRRDAPRDGRQRAELCGLRRAQRHDLVLPGGGRQCGRPVRPVGRGRRPRALTLLGRGLAAQRGVERAAEVAHEVDAEERHPPGAADQVRVGGRRVRARRDQQDDAREQQRHGQRGEDQREAVGEEARGVEAAREPGAAGLRDLGGHDRERERRSTTTWSQIASAEGRSSRSAIV